MSIAEVSRLRCSAVVHQPAHVVRAGLPRLLVHHLGFENGSLRIDLPAHAVAELAAMPLNSMDLTPAQERWYPAFSGCLKLVQLHEPDRTDITITGEVEYGPGPLRDTYYQRKLVQTALLHLLQLMQHYFARKNLPQGPAAIHV